jgi:CheY-like chemotaxis protein
MEPDNEFRKQVKDALEHLYDTAYLETHPLLSQFPNPATDSRLTRAQKLRSLLKETIEALRPQEGSPVGSPEWRSYLALRYRFVQGMSPGEAEIELGISLRQLQRELHKGLDAAATHLWEKRSPAPAPPQEAAKELRDELSQWEISRQNCEVRTLLDDTLWMCKPLLDERHVTTQVDLPANLAPVFVDATLTRQALFKVLRVLAKSCRDETLNCRAREEERAIEIVLQCQAQGGFETEEDWKVAQVICEQQGSPLTTKALDGGIQVVLRLPRASQPRVLVIDDNAALHQLFERYLAPHHYQVIHARSGPEGLQLAVERRPDAITLDVMMPNVDGWQVLRELVANPQTAAIPIVVCSVLKEPELALSLGARAFLNKPVERLELVTTLARLLSSAAPSAAAPQSAPEGS